MKISNSKKQLARIISENGGWPEGAESAAQCIKGEISFWHDTATKRRGEDWCGSYLGADHDVEFTGGKLPNWHQTVLARDEYFHLYPAKDADGWIEWKGGECPVEKEVVVEVYLRKGRPSLDGPKKASRWDWSVDGHAGDIVKYRLHKQEHPNGIEPTSPLTPAPTIEQLAAEYRNRQDYAERKQQEADEAKTEAEAKLKELVAAGKAAGLVVGVASNEPELVITDWRDLQVGDEIATTSGRKLTVTGLRQHDESWPIDADDEDGCEWCVSANDWRFIRRPAKGDANA